MAFARVLEGHLYDVSSNPITLQTGWNWIGYPYYEEHPLSVIQNPTEGDYITSQEGFAEFADGYWQGSISSFVPGAGYLYKSVDSKPLTFNFASHTAPVCLPKHLDWNPDLLYSLSLKENCFSTKNTSDTKCMSFPQELFQFSVDNVCLCLAKFALY